MASLQNTSTTEHLGCRGQIAVNVLGTALAYIHAEVSYKYDV